MKHGEFLLITGVNAVDLMRVDVFVRPGMDADTYTLPLSIYTMTRMNKSVASEESVFYLANRDTLLDKTGRVGVVGAGVWRTRPLARHRLVKT